MARQLPYDREFTLWSIKTRAAAWGLFAEAEFLAKTFRTVEALEDFVSYAESWKAQGRRLTHSMHRVLASCAVAGSLERLVAQVNFIVQFHRDGDHLYEDAARAQAQAAATFQEVYARSGIRFTRALCTSCRLCETVPLRGQPPCPTCGKPLSLELEAA